MTSQSGRRFGGWKLERVGGGWMLSNPYKGHAVHDKTPWKAWRRWKRVNP